MDEQFKDKSAVLYCDGGFQQHLKIGGWGIHGYVYAREVPKKGTGNPKAIPTDKGYQGEGVTGNKVTPLAYVDACAGLQNVNSSNETELHAFNLALKWLHKTELADAQVFSDSRYVVQGINQWTNKWAERGWRTSNGEPVANKELWIETDALWKEVKAKIPKLTMEWIKGHNGHFGNGKADEMATKGSIIGMKLMDDEYFAVQEADGYFSRRYNTPRMLRAPRWYFGTLDDDFVREGGKYVYYVGNHGTKDKEPELLGKRYADNFFGVVFMAEPDPALEKLRLKAMENDRRKIGSIMIGYLDNVFKPDSYRELCDHDTLFLNWNDRRLDVIDHNKRPLLVELRPAGLGYRAVDSLTAIDRMLVSILKGDRYYVKTELTDELYESPDKKGIRKLKASITTMTRHLEAQAQYSTALLRERPVEGHDLTLKTISLRLILGSDMLSRNDLSALGEIIKSVHVVTWRETETVIRYATMVETIQGDVGLWMCNDSNYLITSL